MDYVVMQHDSLGLIAPLQQVLFNSSSVKKWGMRTLLGSMSIVMDSLMISFFLGFLAGIDDLTMLDGTPPRKLLSSLETCREADLNQPPRGVMGTRNSPRSV